jgi:hypothetical protein
MATSNEWSIPAVLDVVTEVAPDREMVVWGDVRRTFADGQDRARAVPYDVNHQYNPTEVADPPTTAGRRKRHWPQTRRRELEDPK